MFERSSFPMVMLVAAAILSAAGCSKTKDKDDLRGEMELAAKSSPAAKGPEKTARRAAPDFVLADLNGKEVKLSAFRGKVVLLNFWATWCPPCRQEIPDFVELQEQYRSQGFEVVGVSMDTQGVSVVTPFARQNRINYTMLVGGDRISGLYGGIQGIPTTFVLDRQGRIAERFVGLNDRATFEKLIKGLLSEG